MMDDSLLEHVPTLVTEEDNFFLNLPVSAEEVKREVDELNGDSACGPDRFNDVYFQKCWDVIGQDVCKVVAGFFDGHTLPKSITHTSLVLLPKKEIVQTFSAMRPISLSNFLNKIISRLIHDRLENLLPKLISHNQSGFVKGRNISENLLLAQKIISDIRNRGKPANVVIKLDMAKFMIELIGYF